MMWILITLCYFFSFNYVRGECLADCNEPILFYNELKCKPVFNSSNECCPTHFDCPKNSDENKCQFRGKIYNIGDSLNDDEIYENCKADCLCTEGYDGEANFECASVDCPEWLGYQADEGCYLTYELDKCCSVGQICSPFNITCKVSDKTYYEGEKFFPYDLKCTKCICRKGFEGEFVEPFCQKERCVEEIGNQKKVKKFCAPSYIRLGDCCPYSWICPQKTDVIVPAVGGSNNLSNLKCKFGKKEFNLGDSLNRVSENGGKLHCECRIPPYLTCVHNYEFSD